MITKLVLGNQAVLHGVMDIQTSIMNINGSMEHTLSIVIGAYESVRPSAEDIYEKLSAPEALSKIIAAKKDYIPEMLDGSGNIIQTAGYSDEYYVEFLKYNNIKAIYKSETSDIVTATLVTTPNDLSDSRYLELLTNYRDLSLAMSEILGL